MAQSHQRPQPLRPQLLPPAERPVLHHQKLPYFPPQLPSVACYPGLAPAAMVLLFAAVPINI